MKEWSVIGIMSGTSLDGVDIAFCKFKENNNRWHYRIEKAETCEYSLEWKRRLQDIYTSSARTFIEIDHALGEYIGVAINDFMERYRLYPDLIASHGHTVFHNPRAGYTCQIGHGSKIAQKTKIPVINDFRSMDVAKGGEGAPLVPLGDSVLFSQYDYCLNLGGFSNISFDDHISGRRAFDLCPCNIVLNALASTLHFDYDKDGALAKSGRVIIPLLKKLNELFFYSQRENPISLGREWLEEVFNPCLNQETEEGEISVFDKLATVVDHIATQISSVVPNDHKATVLLTGGGAHNNYLVDRIRSFSSATYIVPEPLLVNYKEAMLFAFFGVLNLLGRPNVLSQVTGASEDCCAGVMWRP